MLPVPPLMLDRRDEPGGRHDAPHGDGEIAIAAAAGAEGDVDVEVHGGNMHRRAGGTRLSVHYRARRNSIPRNTNGAAISAIAPRSLRSTVTLETDLSAKATLQLSHERGDASGIP